ncbi:MAG: RidA family protein [Pirellulales bacterium]
MRKLLVLSCLLAALPVAGNTAVPAEEKTSNSTATIARISLTERPGEADAVVAPARPLVHTAQLLPTDAAGKVPAGENAARQFARVIDQLATTLTASQSTLADIVKLNIYVASDEVAATVRKELAGRFAEFPPAVCYVVTRLPQTDALVALDAVAVSRLELAYTEVRMVRATQPTTASTSYLAAITPVGSRVYVAGQAEKGDLRQATLRTLQSLDATLKFLKLEWSDVAQVKSFVTPMAAVADSEDEFRKFFGERPPPPLVWVEWESGLPIEIELVASANRGKSAASDSSTPSTDLEFLTPPGMTTPTIYSRVARTHHPRTIYIAGLYGESLRDGGTQVEQIFGQLREALQRTGSDLEHLAKATYYVSDNDASAKLNELRPRYYNPKRPPAASKAQVRGVARPGNSITLDMIATPRK